MRSFEEIFSIAADRQGGAQALEQLLTAPKTSLELERLSDRRWLATMAKCIFQAGFNWTVVEEKWSSFEEAFEKFDPKSVATFREEDTDRLLSKYMSMRTYDEAATTVQIGIIHTRKAVVFVHVWEDAQRQPMWLSEAQEEVFFVSLWETRASVI